MPHDLSTLRTQVEQLQQQLPALLETFLGRRPLLIDLEAIFGDSPDATTCIVPEPQAARTAPVLGGATGNLGLQETIPEPVPAPSDEPDTDAPPFPGWILCADVAGRMGCEPPDLPEERRSRARARFEDLPTLAAYFPGSAHRPEDGSRPWCGRSKWWRSKVWRDVIRCGRCSPPAPGMAVEWLNRPEAGPAKKSVAQDAGCCVPAGSVDT